MKPIGTPEQVDHTPRQGGESNEEKLQKAIDRSVAEGQAHLKIRLKKVSETVDEAHAKGKEPFDAEKLHNMCGCDITTPGALERHKASYYLDHPKMSLRQFANLLQNIE